jgi:hypothetical protein
MSPTGLSPALPPGLGTCLAQSSSVRRVAVVPALAALSITGPALLELVCLRLQLLELGATDHGDGHGAGSFSSMLSCGLLRCEWLYQMILRGNSTLLPQIMIDIFVFNSHNKYVL